MKVRAFRAGLCFGIGAGAGLVGGFLVALHVVEWLDRRGLKWPPK